MIPKPVDRVEHRARLGSRRDVAFVLVLEGEHEPGRGDRRGRVVELPAEIGQSRRRIGLAPVAEGADDRRAERPGGAHGVVEHDPVVLAPVTLEERRGDRTDREPTDARAPPARAASSASEHVDDLPAVEGAQLDRPDLQLLAHVEGAREARVDLVRHDTQVHRDCLYLTTLGSMPGTFAERLREGPPSSPTAASASCSPPPSPGCVPEEANLRAPRRSSRHLSFINAGAELIETNSFGANRRKLAQHYLDDEFERINSAAVKLAREAREITGREVFIGASIGPAGEQRPGRRSPSRRGSSRDAAPTSSCSRRSTTSRSSTSRSKACARCRASRSSR